MKILVHNNDYTDSAVRLITVRGQLKRAFCFVFLLFVFATEANAAVEIKNQYFRLTLPEDWMQQPSSDPEQFVFTSVVRKAQVTVSVMPMNAKGRNLDSIADKMLKIRFKAEHAVAPERKVAIGTPWRSNPAGGGVQINYLGHDNLNRHFFYTGFITDTGITNVTGELEESNEQILKAFYKEVLGNFGY
jgi:hypothetical protein